MAPPVWSKTIDIRVNNFPAGSASSDIALAIRDFFAGESFEIRSIQQYPGNIARITFLDNAPKLIFERRGEIKIGDVTCAVIAPRPPAPRVDRVVVYWYPYEADNGAVERELRKYGVVDEVRYQRWTNLPEVSTGTRIVRIKRARHIPRFIIIDGFRCKVWYSDQPIVCDLCRKSGHRASDCPAKGKCFRCHQPGHMSRNCPDPQGVRSGPTLAEVVASGSDARPARFTAGDANDANDANDESPPLIFSDELDLGFTEVVEEGTINPPPVPPSTEPIVMDSRFGQIDDVPSQGSQSILRNCRPSQISPGNQTTNVQQSNLSSDSNSSGNNVVNDTLSNSNENRNSNRNGNSNGNRNSNGNGNSNEIRNSNENESSEPSGNSAGPSNSVDSEMGEVSGSRKRTVDEVEIEDDEFFDSLSGASAPAPPVTRSNSKKKNDSAKKSTLSAGASSSEVIEDFSDSESRAAPAVSSIPRLASKKKAVVAKKSAPPGRHFMNAGLSHAATLASSSRRPTSK